MLNINGQTAPGSIREHFARMNGQRFSIGHTAEVRCRFYPRPGMAISDGDSTYTIRESKAVPAGFELVLG